MMAILRVLKPCSPAFLSNEGLLIVHFSHRKGDAYNLFTKLTIGKNCSIFSSLTDLHLIKISSLPLWIGSHGKEDFY